MVNGDSGIPGLAGVRPLAAEELQAEMAQLAADFAPRRFAIFEVAADRLDASVFAWGLAWPDRVVICDDDGFRARRFATVDGALRASGQSDRLHLIWIDEAAGVRPQ